MLADREPGKQRQELCLASPWLNSPLIVSFQKQDAADLVGDPDSRSGVLPGSAVYCLHIVPKPQGNHSGLANAAATGRQ